MTTIIVIIIVVFFATISGGLSKDLQQKKGYDGGFWIGFLLGIFGLIYSAGLPDISKKKIIKRDNEQVIEKIEKKEILPKEEEDNGNYIVCKCCGFPIYEDEKVCSNCGYEKTKNKNV